MKLYRNNCDISLLLQIDNSLNSLTQSIQLSWYAWTFYKTNILLLYCIILCILKSSISFSVSYNYVTVTVTSVTHPSHFVTYVIITHVIMPYFHLSLKIKKSKMKWNETKSIVYNTNTYLLLWISLNVKRYHIFI